MSLSKQLQQGKAAEHLVCADLILQGYNAFLADQGLAFDVVVEVGGSLKRIQVKSSRKATIVGNSNKCYQFNLRKGFDGHLARIEEIDYVAFVALDIKKIAYLPINKVRTNSLTHQSVRMKTRSMTFVGRRYLSGKKRIVSWGKYLEDYQKFPRQT